LAAAEEGDELGRWLKERRGEERRWGWLERGREERWSG